MLKLKNTFAIGCLVQWYEVEIFDEYFQSLKMAIQDVENKENVVIDICFNMSQSLEKIDESQMKLQDIFKRFISYRTEVVKLHVPERNITYYQDDSKPYTIADYRREFNDRYCEKVDVLMWGETDSLIPRQTFQILDGLHTQVKDNTPKYVSFFGTCKMWDDSWKPVEHTKFIDKPFIDNDYKNWWSVKYTMSIDEMNEINDKVEELDVRIVNPYKFNGCGLVISSEVVKSGVNIPRSVFFVHEDTAFLHMLTKLFDGNIPQYVIKNILLVHNRNHPEKRMYVKGETGETMNMKRRSNDWYTKANPMCEHNAYNIFNQVKNYTWKDILK